MSIPSLFFRVGFLYLFIQYFFIGEIDMPTLSTPQSQAGVLSFYDAPEKGPRMNAKVFLVAVFVFAVLIIIFDHFVAYK